MITGTTASICPVCLERIAAQRVLRDNDLYLTKTCPTHGSFESVIWRNVDDTIHDIWSYIPRDDPSDWNIRNSTCCALVEVTSRCDLRCSVCFADAGIDAAEATVAALFDCFRKLVDNGNTFVQLSGGEPTVRSDLPEIIAAARKAGMETVQLNTNGVALGQSAELAKIYADAGLSFIFMQFDGITQRPHEILRGSGALLEIKKETIRICDRANLGVTLVPTIVPGVNDNEIGAIVNFALSQSPAVRGVHFQPVSYFGRYRNPPSDSDRITLPEIIRAIEIQTDGRIKATDLAPGSCDHPRCGFHGDFVVLPKGRLLKLTRKYDPNQSCCDDAHIKNRNFVSRRWTRPTRSENTTDSDNYRDMSAFLSRANSHGFTISGMAFQDAGTLELERIQRCSLHVADLDGSVTPFCLRYLTAQKP